MDIQRAKEISSSSVMADVTLEGTPVYIQSVNEETKQAIIYPLTEPEVVQEVPVGRLQEWDNH